MLDGRPPAAQHGRLMNDAITDQRAATRLVFVFGLGALASSLATRVLDPMVPLLSTEFLASPERVALLASAFALPYALVQPVLGPVGDALGKQRIIAFCLLALMLALAACALAPSLETLFVARLLSGAAAGGTMPLMLAIFGDRVPLHLRQVAMSRLLVCAIAGQISGGAMAGLLSPFIGWRGVVMVCAAIAAGALLALRLGAGRSQEPRARFDLSVALTRYRTILGNPLARRCYTGVFAEGVLIFGIFPHLAEELTRRGLGGSAQAGISLAAFGAGGVCYGLLAPLLVARLGNANMIRLGGALIATGLVSIGLAPFTAMVVGACLLTGLGFFMMHNSIQTRVTEVAPTARGSAVALHAFSFFMGQSLGPALFGLGQPLAGTVLMTGASGFGIVATAFWLARR